MEATVASRPITHRLTDAAHHRKGLVPQPPRRPRPVGRTLWNRILEIMKMTKVDMMREAVKELGDAPAEALAGYIENKHGVKINPKFVPILKASVRERELLEAFRQKMKETTVEGTDASTQAA
jgi:hypothetical protein